MLPNSDLPVIAITTWGEAPVGRAPRIAGARSYFEALEDAGGAPFGLPPLRPSTLRVLFEMADGLLLTGGGDVNPARYGEEPVPEIGHIENERDEAEFQLTEWALRENKPVLAICRGMQVLNVACGGTLYQDLPTQYPNGLNHTESTDRGLRGLATHSLDLSPDTRLERAVGGSSVPVNTHHHQAVKVLGDGLVITGRSEDGVVESLEHGSLDWVVGVQCHPEEMWREHPWATRLFEAFVAEARHSARHIPTRMSGALNKPTQ